MKIYQTRSKCKFKSKNKNSKNLNDKNKINCKFINGKVRNMELPILLKEKLEQEIDEIELKKLKQSAQNISEKYRD